MEVRIRRVRDVDELRALFDAIAQQFEPALEVERRLDEPIATFDDSRPLMLCVERDVGTSSTLAGGLIGFRNERGCTVRAIGVAADLRWLGIGRRLMEIAELEAMAMGERSISLGAATAARGFYDRLGYRAGRLKELPLPGRVRDLRVAKLRSAIGDLDAGVIVGAH